jgi:uncharacterized protein involved in exopolysaccharide biosynthesis
LVEAAEHEFRWSAEIVNGAARLRARKRAIALVAIAFVAVALAYLAVVSPRYQASTEILVDPRGLQVVANDVTPRSENNESAISLVESEMRVVQSEAVLRAVVEALDLEHDPEFSRRPGWLQRFLGVFSSGRTEDPTTRAVRALQRAIDVSRGSRSYVITVSAKSSDPSKAAVIANTLADLYIKHEVEARADAAQRVEGAMKARHKELADRVHASDDAVESFKARHNLIGTAARLISDQQLEEANTRLTAEHANVVQLFSRVEELDKLVKAGVPPDAIVEAVQSTTIANLRAQFAQVVRRQEMAAAVLGPRHPDVIALHQQRETYQRLIAEELKRIAGAAKSDYRRAVASEQAMSANLQALKNTTIRSNEAMVKLRELERQSQSDRDIYQAFLVRAKEIGVQSGLDTSNTRVISAALPPIRASGPRLLLVLMGALAGLALASTYFWLFGPTPKPATH